MTKFVEISSLVTEGLQTRDGLAKAVVKDYAETLKAGMRLPPVTVVQDSVSGQLYLVDGYHRKAAAVMAGRTMIDAEITEGTFTDAVRLAIRANATNGLRRTNADKRNALKLAWEHRRELFPGEPSHELLAKACGVSERTRQAVPQSADRGGQCPPPWNAPRHGWQDLCAFTAGRQAVNGNRPLRRGGSRTARQGV